MFEYKNLRRCSADVLTPHYHGIALRNNETGELVEIPMNSAYVLRSYASIVAVFDDDNKVLYLLPRAKYSITTQQHVRKFAEDYCGAHTRKQMDEFTDDWSMKDNDWYWWKRY